MSVDDDSARGRFWSVDDHALFVQHAGALAASMDLE
jgi:hypothetical protein